MVVIAGVEELFVFCANSPLGAPAVAEDDAVFAPVEAGVEPAFPNKLVD